jgi:hypothetical protein
MASASVAERVDGAQEELISEVKDTYEEGDGRSISSSQEERQMLPETSAKSRCFKKVYLSENDVK